MEGPRPTSRPLIARRRRPATTWKTLAFDALPGFPSLGGNLISVKMTVGKLVDVPKAHRTGTWEVTDSLTDRQTVGKLNGGTV